MIINFFTFSYLNKNFYDLIINKKLANPFIIQTTKTPKYYPTKKMTATKTQT